MGGRGALERGYGSREALEGCSWEGSSLWGLKEEEGPAGLSKGSSLSSLAVESRQGDCRSGEGGPSSFSGLGRAGVFCALLHLAPVGPAWPRQGCLQLEQVWITCLPLVAAAAWSAARALAASVAEVAGEVTASTGLGTAVACSASGPRAGTAALAAAHFSCLRRHLGARGPL